MKKILYHIFLLLCIAVFCISAYKLYGYYKSYKEAKDTYEKIKKDNVKKTNGDRTIDFDKLRAKNPDIVGWVYAKGTGIDYPIVQGKDNEEYLHMDYNKKKSSSGTIFLDHGCDKSFISDNNIIYGHHMKTHSMFTDLLLYEDEQFAREHPIQFSTLEETGVYRVIAALQADNNSALPFYKTTDFSDLGQFERWIQTVESASLYDMNIEANAGDTYITLITCRESSSVNERFIVVARESGEK